MGEAPFPIRIHLSTSICRPGSLTTTHLGDHSIANRLAVVRPPLKDLLSALLQLFTRCLASLRSASQWWVKIGNQH